MRAREWPLVAFMDGFNAYACIPQFFDIGAPSWSGLVNWCTALSASIDKFVKRPSIAAFECQVFCVATD